MRQPILAGFQPDFAESVRALVSQVGRTGQAGLGRPTLPGRRDERGGGLLVGAVERDRLEENASEGTSQHPEMQPERRNFSDETSAPANSGSRVKRIRAARFLGLGRGLNGVGGRRDMEL